MSPERFALRSPGSGFVATVCTTGARIASLRHVDPRTGEETEFLLQVDGRDEDPFDTAPIGDTNRRWHERFAGGWHTLIPHAGDERRVDGVEHPFHGEAAWLPWRLLARDDASCALEVALATVPATVTRVIEATPGGIRITQRVENPSPDPIALTWTEHPSFSSALISPESRVLLGGRDLDVPFPAEGETSSGFRTEPAGSDGVASLVAPRWTAELRWDPALFPFLHVWQEHRATAGFPWWGRTDTIALEPANRPYEARGDALGPLVVEPGSAASATFLLDVRAS